MSISKAKKLLSVVLVLSLLVVSIAQVGVFTASAENAAPVYDSATQTIVGTYTTGLLTNGTVELQTMEGIKDETKAVYTSVTVEKSSNYTGWFSPYIMLAETDYKASETDNGTYYLGVRLTGSYGWSLSLLNDQSQVVTFYDGLGYADGTWNMPSAVKITYVIANGKASIWIDGVLCVLDFSNECYNVTKPVLGSCINGYGYYLSGNSWIDNDPEPTYNAETQTVIANYGTGLLTNGTATFQEMTGFDPTKPVYTNVTVEKSSNYTGWFSPYVMIAETDYKSSEGDTATWCVGFRFISSYGWSLCLLNDQNQTKYILADKPYADGSNNMPNAINFTYVVDNGKLSVWLEGKQLALDYTNDSYNITKPVLGSCINGYGYYLSGKTWINNGEELVISEPTCDPETQTIVSAFTTGLLSNGAAEFQSIEGILDDTKAVYSTVTVEKSSNYTGWFSPYVMLAETDFKLSADDTRTWYYGLRFTAGYGWSLNLLNNQDQGMVMLDGQPYVNGTANMPNSVTVTTAIEDGKVSLWVDGVNIVNDKKYDAFNIKKTAIGSCINGYGYYLGGKVWTAKDNIVSDLPEFNSETDALMFNKGEVVLSDSGLVKYDAYYIEDYFAPVYTEYTVKKEDYVTGWFSPCIALAETDYVSGDSEYYLGIRMTADYGYAICLINEAMNQTQYVVDNAAYPDTGTGVMSNNEYKITVLTDNGTVSVWINGLKVLDEYSNEEYYTIMGPAAYGYINGYSYSLGVNTWTAIDNYNRLGDLNGDAAINLIDLIRMKKIAANVEGASAINDYVIAFNSEGTITTEELVLMRKYIIGAIDSFDDAIEYGYDAVSASELQ